MIKFLKKFVSINFLALAGWLNLLIYLWMFSIEHHARQISDGTDNGTWLFWILCLGVSVGLFCIAIITGIIEYVTKYKIKNSFILENNFYTLFFMIGLPIGVISSLIGTSIIVYSIFSSLR